MASEPEWEYRYEMAVDTRLELRRPGQREMQLPTEPIEIRFRGRTFTWYPGTHDLHAVVALVSEARTDEEQAEERLLFERFLSALSFETGCQIRSIASSGLGLTRREVGSRSVITQPRASIIIMPAAEVLDVPDDNDLERCLALMREGGTSGSYALEFLSYWKVVEIAVGRHQFGAWINVEAPSVHQMWLWGEKPPPDWFDYSSNYVQ